jgi:hypothetical protein
VVNNARCLALGVVLSLSLLARLVERERERERESTIVECRLTAAAGSFDLAITVEPGSLVDLTFD